MYSRRTMQAMEEMIQDHVMMEEIIQDHVNPREEYSGLAEMLSEQLQE